MSKFLCVIIVITLIGCGPTPYFSESYELDPLGWTSEEKILFQPEIVDTSASYELQLIVDHEMTYSYENIYFRIKTLFPDRPAQEENLSVDLATKTGQWVGNCSGGHCKAKVYLLDNFKFPTKGTFGFELLQYTRDESLAGINSLKMELYTKVKD